MKKEKKPVVEAKHVEEAAKRLCPCSEDEKKLNAKQLEWYDSMIEGHKQQMKDSKRNAVLGTIVMVFSALAMLTIIALNIARFFIGD